MTDNASPLQSDLAEYYDREAGAGARGAVRAHRAELRGEYIEAVRAEGRHNVLEIGSSPGRDAAAFIENDFRYVGVDLGSTNLLFSVSRTELSQ